MLMLKGNMSARLYGLTIGALCILTSACANEMASGPETPEGLNCQTIPTVSVRDDRPGPKRTPKEWVQGMLHDRSTLGSGTQAELDDRLIARQTVMVLAMRSVKKEHEVPAEIVAATEEVAQMPAVKATLDRIDKLKRMANERRAERTRAARSGRPSLRYLADSVDIEIAKEDIYAVGVGLYGSSSTATYIEAERDVQAGYFPADTVYQRVVATAAGYADTVSVVTSSAVFEMYADIFTNPPWASMVGGCGDTRPYTGGVQGLLPECEWCPSLYVAIYTAVTAILIVGIAGVTTPVLAAVAGAYAFANWYVDEDHYNMVMNDVPGWWEAGVNAMSRAAAKVADWWFSQPWPAGYMSSGQWGTE